MRRASRAGKDVGSREQNHCHGQDGNFFRQCCFEAPFALQGSSLLPPTLAPIIQGAPLLRPTTRASHFKRLSCRRDGRRVL